jgi:hypothetical protein
MDQHPLDPNRKGKSLEPLVRKAGWERKLRHQSRVEKLAARPKVKKGRLLDEDAEDERVWARSALSTNLTAFGKHVLGNQSNGQCDQSRNNDQIIQMSKDRDKIRN